MTGLLDRIVHQTRKGLVERRAQVPLALLERRAGRAPPARSLRAALSQNGMGLIAELKAQSPSAGVLCRNYDVAAGARAYVRGGARALSILTEPVFFGGKPEDLLSARKAVGVPLLRKDFIVDPYQVVEARAHGADAVLLIVRLLTDWELSLLQGLARTWGMDALVETHTAEELSRAKRAGAPLIGINSRNLDTLSLSPHAFERLVPRAPQGATLVGESGIKTPADVRRLAALGVQGLLVGESLLRQGDLESAARNLMAVS